MQGSISLTSSPDGVSISSREREQMITRGNKVSSFLYCYEKEYRWQHKVAWATFTEQMLGELNATLRVSAVKFQQPWVHV